MIEVAFAIAFLITAILIGLFALPQPILTIDEMAALSEAIGRSLQELAAAGEEATRAMTAMVEICEQMRREHPEWFDPTTGYMITD